ncbi:MAG TPA: hypothetical protein VMC79_01135 [Rectinemataceae bacterium]|nr:hypothetical protein [Rectinemataceae bacterium]
MNDIEPVDSRELSNRGFKGVSATVGGVALLVLKGIAGWLGGIVGLGIGVIAMGVGLSSLKSSSKADKTGGVVALGAGALLALTGIAHWHIPIISGIAGLSTGLVTLGAVGLIGYGVWNIIKFVRGLRSRA